MSLVVTMVGHNVLSPELRRATTDMGRLNKSTAATGLKFAKFGALAAGAIGFLSTKIAMDLEKGLREVGTLMGGLTDKQMADMSKELRLLGISSGQAMNSLVKAKYDIVSAGFANAAESAEVLNQSALLATGGVTSVANAADLLTTSLNAYRLEAKMSEEVSDKLFTVVRLGKTTMNELGSSMGRVLAVAGQAGVSLDEVGAAMATLTAMGQKTEEATTGVRGAIVQMLKPTGALESVIRKAGFASGTAMIQQLGFAGALQELKRRADDSNIPMTDLFTSIEAMQAVLPLTGSAASRFATNLEEMKNAAGATALAVEEMEKSASFQLKRLGNVFVNIGTNIGDKFLPVVAKLAKGIADFAMATAPAKEEAENMAIATIRLSEQRAQEIEDLKAATEWVNNYHHAVNNLFNLQNQPPPVQIEVPETPDPLGEASLAQRLQFLAKNHAEELDMIGQFGQAAGQLYQSIADKRTGTIRRGLEKNLKEEQKTFDATVAQIIASNTIEGELTAEGQRLIAEATKAHNETVQSLNEKARADEVAALAKLKPIKYAQAISNIALGISEALGSAPPPWNLALAAITAAAGAVQLSAIASSPFQFGGRVPARGTDTVPAMLSPGEIVSTAQAANQFGDQIAELNQAAVGGGAGAGGPVEVNIYALDGADVERVIRSNPQSFASGIRHIVRQRHLTAEDLPRG